MKKIIVAILLLLTVSSHALAWEKINKTTYSIYGTRIASSDNQVLSQFAELVYNVTTDSFGISFIRSNGDRVILPYGIFDMRSCGSLNTRGAIVKTLLLDVANKDQLDLIFLDCKRPIFFRVYDTYGQSVLYKFENAGPLPQGD